MRQAALQTQVGHRGMSGKIRAFHDPLGTWEARPRTRGLSASGCTPAAMIPRPRVKRRRETPAEHGLQYGQDWPFRYFANDISLMGRVTYPPGRLEPPQPRPPYLAQDSPDRIPMQLRNKLAASPVTDKRPVIDLARCKQGALREGSADLGLQPALTLVRRGVGIPSQVGMPSPAVSGRAPLMPS